MRQKKFQLLIVGISTLIIMGILSVAFVKRQFTRTEEPRIAGDYQKVPLEEAAGLAGFPIPLPAYVPEGYVFDGVYVYFAGEAANNDARRPPGSAFQVRYKNDREEWLIVRLYGGDMRSKDAYESTGGDIPTDFDLPGEIVQISGHGGVLQMDLNEQAFTSNGTTLRARLVWRVPYTSEETPGLAAIFLSLESISLENSTLSASVLQDVAESVSLLPR